VGGEYEDMGEETFWIERQLAKYPEGIKNIRDTGRRTKELMGTGETKFTSFD